MMFIDDDQGLLFPLQPRYPAAPGFKSPDTSMQAAFKIAAHAKTLRAVVLRQYLASEKPMTPDQVASALGESILSIRPRCSELKRAGLLEAAPITLANPSSGHQARALRATSKATEAAR